MVASKEHHCGEIDGEASIYEKYTNLVDVFRAYVYTYDVEARPSSTYRTRGYVERARENTKRDIRS